MLSGSPNKLVGIAPLHSLQSYFLMFLGASLIFSNASASILQKTSVAEMTHEADAVVEGEIVSTWTSPEPELKMYTTYAKLVITSVHKGSITKQEMLLRQPGGDYQNPTTGHFTHQKVFGMQALEKGKGLFFINYNKKDGAPMVMFQGRYDIVTDKETGEDNIVYPDSPDVEYSDRHLEHEQRSFYAINKQDSLQKFTQEIEKTVIQNRRR